MNLVLSRETDAPERDAAAPAADQSPARRSFPALCMWPTLKVKTPPERLAHFGDETIFLVPSSFGSSLDPAGSPHCSHSAWCKTSPSFPASLLTWRNVHSLDIVHIFYKFPLPLLLLPKVSGPEVHLNPWNRICMHPKGNPPTTWACQVRRPCRGFASGPCKGWVWIPCGTNGNEA